MTDLEILTDSVNSLGGIQVPIALFETIGVPVSRVRRNLIALMTAISKQQSEESENLIKMEGENSDDQQTTNDTE